MSAFGRSFLRLAACAALRNMTLVGEQVFDSRIAALDPETFMPNLADVAGSIGVYTEQDSGEALSSANGGPPFRPEIELVLEIAMQGLFKSENDEAYVVDAPLTDDHLEMTLDVIEGQAELALFRRVEPASVAFRLLTKQTSKKTAIRFTDPKSSAKFALRYVTYSIEIADPEIPIFDASLSGLDRLPEPWKSVALAWPSDSPEREKAARLADLLTAPARPAFEEMVATIPPPPQVPPSEHPDDPQIATWNIPQ